MVGWMDGNVLFNDTLNTFFIWLYGWMDGNVLFNNALNTFFIWLYGWMDGNVLFNDTLNTFLFCGYMDEWMEMFYLTTHSTHFYMVKWMDGWKCFI